MQTMLIALPDDLMTFIRDEARAYGTTVNDLIASKFTKSFARKRQCFAYMGSIAAFLMSEAPEGRWYEYCEIYNQDILDSQFADRDDTRAILRGIGPVMRSLGFKYVQIKRKGVHTRVWVRNEPVNMDSPLIRAKLGL